MTLDAQYAKSAIGTEVHGLLKTGVENDCGICGNKTTWADINFEVTICSKECQMKLIDAYLQSTGQGGPDA